jgi:hypothetical protein
MRTNVEEWVIAMNGRWTGNTAAFDNLGSALLFSRFFHQPVKFVVEERHIRLHDEQFRININNNRTRELGLPSTLRLDEWLLILARFNYKCAYCGGKFESLDHIVPVCQGGGTTAVNVVPACRPCNNRKGGAIWL